MDFYKKIMSFKYWKEFLEFLSMMNLHIIKEEMSFLNKIKYFLNLNFEKSLIISNGLVSYKITLIFIPNEKDFILKVKDISVLK